MRINQQTAAVHLTRAVPVYKDKCVKCDIPLYGLCTLSFSPDYDMDIRNGDGNLVDRLYMTPSARGMLFLMLKAIEENKVTELWDNLLK